MITYTIGELTAYISELIKSDERLQDVWVTGEISNLTRAASGHVYFTLKDRAAELKSVMWRSAAERQGFVPKNGDAVLAHGYIAVYEERGAYQFYADRIRPVGIGDLYQQFEALKAKLDAEGLFAAERKRPLPPFPRQIGVVTSADAAAFRDVLNVLRRRFPLAEVILSPCLVQSEDAPPQIVVALERLNRHTQVDVIIVCRGGGSIEDLWAFNDERVARAIAFSRIPVISGVGHETDFTIADFAADLRAPTPSAAAELVTPDIADIRISISQLYAALVDATENAIIERGDALAAEARALKRASPLVQLRTLRQRLDDWNSRMVGTQRGRIALLRERLAARDAVLYAASPQAILERGYAIVTRRADGARLKSVTDAAPGADITVQLHDGSFGAKIEAPE